jgi:hypothetical protein
VARSDAVAEVDGVPPEDLIHCVVIYHTRPCIVIGHPVPVQSDGGAWKVSARPRSGAAEMRAEESHRPDRLFDDPLAAAFVDAAPPLFPDLPSLTDDPELSALKDAFLSEIAIPHAVLRRLPSRGVRRPAAFRL